MLLGMKKEHLCMFGRMKAIFLLKTLKTIASSELSGSALDVHQLISGNASPCFRSWDWRTESISLLECRQQEVVFLCHFPRYFWCFNHAVRSDSLSAIAVDNKSMWLTKLMHLKSLAQKPWNVLMREITNLPFPSAHPLTINPTHPKKLS